MQIKFDSSALIYWYNNNRRAAAKSLGMSERTLYRKINDYGIEKKIKKDN